MNLRNKETEFPKHVLEVKEALAASNDKRLDVMKKLTEVKDKQDKNEIKIYHRLWTNLYKEETQVTQDIDNSWVYSFLDDVIKAISLPNFVLKTKKEREDILSKIRHHNNVLKNLYVDNELCSSIVVNDTQFYGGFSSSKEDLHESIKQFRLEKKIKHPIEIILDVYLESAQDEMSEYIEKDEKGENAEATRFIRMLGARNFLTYNHALNSVLIDTTFAIYGIWIDEDNMSNKIRRSNGLKKYLNYYDQIPLPE